MIYYVCLQNSLLEHKKYQQPWMQLYSGLIPTWIIFGGANGNYEAFVICIKASRILRKEWPMSLTLQIINRDQVWHYFIWNHLGPIDYVKTNDFEIHMFLNFSNDFRWKNDQKQSCRLWGVLKLSSRNLFHLNSYWTSDNRENSICGAKLFGGPFSKYGGVNTRMILLKLLWGAMVTGVTREA